MGSAEQQGLRMGLHMNNNGCNINASNSNSKSNSNDSIGNAKIVLYCIDMQKHGGTPSKKQRLVRKICNNPAGLVFPWPYCAA